MHIASLEKNANWIKKSLQSPKSGPNSVCCEASATKLCSYFALHCDYEISNFTKKWSPTTSLWPLPLYVLLEHDIVITVAKHRHLLHIIQRSVFIPKQIITVVWWVKWLFHVPSQEAEVALKTAVRLAPAYSEAVFALARLLATTTAGGRRLREGQYSNGKRLEQVWRYVNIAI